MEGEGGAPKLTLKTTVEDGEPTEGSEEAVDREAAELSVEGAELDSLKEDAPKLKLAEGEREEPPVEEEGLPLELKLAVEVGEELPEDDELPTEPLGEPKLSVTEIEAEPVRDG